MLIRCNHINLLESLPTWERGGGSPLGGLLITGSLLGIGGIRASGVIIGVKANLLGVRFRSGRGGGSGPALAISFTSTGADGEVLVPSNGDPTLWSFT